MNEPEKIQHLNIDEYNQSKPDNQWKNAIGLYLGGVLTLAAFAYGCKALLSFL